MFDVTVSTSNGYEAMFVQVNRSQNLVLKFGNNHSGETAIMPVTN